MTSPMATPMPWNLVSAAYTAEVVPVFEAYARDALAIAKVGAGTRVVDVACGPGTLAILAAQAGARVDAIDFSAPMIEHCNARVAQLGVTGVTTRVGDGQALPYADASFDAAFSMFGVMFFPDRAKGLAELRRVLVPGGRALIATWTRLEDTLGLAAMFGALRETMGKLLGPAAPPQTAPDLPLTTEDACRAEMSAAFRDVEVRRVPHAQRYASAGELWAALQRTMAPIALMKQMMGPKWAALDEAGGAALRGAVGAGEIEMTMTALFTTGVAA